MYAIASRVLLGPISSGTHAARDAGHSETQFFLRHMPHVTRGMVRNSFSYDTHYAHDARHGENLLTAHMMHVTRGIVRNSSFYGTHDAHETGLGEKHLPRHT